MQPTTKINCPVCGRPNTQVERCTFCGTDLREMSRLTTGKQESGPSSQDIPPKPKDEYTSSYPSTPHPPAPYQGTGQVPTYAPYYAGFWIRALAYSIDGVILHVLVGFLLAIGLLGYFAGVSQWGFDDLLSRIFEMNLNFVQAAAAVINLAYFTIFLGRKGQTPGKMICGLRVIRVDGGTPSYGQALLRTVGYYINAFTLCLGFLWVAIDRKRQGLHDKIAGTYEIRVGLAQIRGWDNPSPGI